MKRFCIHGHDTQIVGRHKEGHCRACTQTRNKAWAKANPDKRRQERRRRSMTGVPETEAKPGHPCDCCGVPIVLQPHADHDHATGKFRGWLCGRCNTRLIALEDASWRAKAEEYLLLATLDYVRPIG